MNNKEFFLRQLDGLINDFDDFRKRAQYEDLSDLNDTIEMARLITKSIATIERIAGKNSEYFKSIQIAYKEKHNYSHAGLIIKHFIGIAHALKEDLSSDYLKSMSELIHADLFSDYLEMASYLLTEGYKNPAAVIAGSTLESHLRKLCEKNFIETEHANKSNDLVPKRADLLNAELSKMEVYNKALQKQVTAWLALRNNAAHGKYDEYTDQEVKLMIAGIMNFMQSYVA